MEQNSQHGLLKFNFSTSIMLKVFIIGILGLLLLIPTVFINFLIEERSNRRIEVMNEVSSKWGQAQTFTGPLLTVPVLVAKEMPNTDNMGYIRRFVHFTPEQLSVSGNLDPELRKRSIYEVMLYRSDLTVSGTFKQPNFSKLGLSVHEILWDEAQVSLGITDLTGIDNRVTLNWDENEIPFQSGLPNKDNFSNGIHVPVNLNSDGNDTYTFNLRLALKGSERFAMTPIGQSSSLKLTSPWTEPSFDGDFLPTHDIDENGFKAEWKVIDLNRNIPERWVGNSEHLFGSSIGVTMLIPVNHYQKNMRSSKYAILIIALTFLTFFLTEVIKGKKIHPLQYIFIGLALVVFYILLLSFSEYLGFNIAYILSGALTISLIVFYSSSIVKNSNFTLVLTGFFILVYSFIFIILQLQDFALLVGALGLFAALATTMYLTRNIDWYSLGKNDTAIA